MNLLPLNLGEKIFIPSRLDFCPMFIYGSTSSSLQSLQTRSSKAESFFRIHKQLYHLQLLTINRSQILNTFITKIYTIKFAGKQHMQHCQVRVTISFIHALILRIFLGNRFWYVHFWYVLISNFCLRQMNCIWNGSSKYQTLNYKFAFIIEFKLFISSLYL